MALRVALGAGCGGREQALAEGLFEGEVAAGGVEVEAWDEEGAVGVLPVVAAGPGPAASSVAGPVVFERAGEDLVRLGGYLPLGASLLTARLRHHPSWSAEDLHERLMAARDRLGELRAGERAVAATSELSYRDLAPERQHFFQCLGFYPGTELDVYLGSALGSVSVVVARQQLDGLYDAQLIDEHPGVDTGFTISCATTLAVSLTEETAWPTYRPLSVCHLLPGRSRCRA
ncbi:hypothetical protein V7793_05580 [Streptomyces sp. KLMMK]|uniref:hypothetical protein n=1 Tax=Streptomyces sp. KLMMK TaxID=3109353 RepID=UPI002FFE2B21